MKLIVYNPSSDKPLPPPSALGPAFQSFDVEFITSKDACISSISNKSQSEKCCFLSTAADLELFMKFKDQAPKGICALITDLPMAQYSQQLNQKEPELLDHVIARRSSQSSLIREIGACLTKIATNNIFGPSVYLRNQNIQKTFKITSSKDRDQLNQAAADFAEKCGMGQMQVKNVFAIAEEMIMNAVYDAPVAAGVARFKDINRMSEINLQSQEEGELNLSFDGEYFCISVSDPFGALEKKKFAEYIRKILIRNDSTKLVDTKAGGAGLGLFKILFSSNALICNIDKGKKTEMMALIDTTDHLRDPSRMPRSISFFVR